MSRPSTDDRRLKTGDYPTTEPLLFEKSSLNDGDHLPPVREGFRVEDALPEGYRTKQGPAIPALSELDVVRHFTRLSQKNFCVDTHFYPLGSCTMKYNPKVNDQVTQWPFFAKIHPYQREEEVQGMLEIIAALEKSLCEITGMDAFSLQPAAGAQGEFAGLLMIRAYHKARGQKRHKVLIPDSAHGTNPASAALCGYEVVQVRTDERGRVDLADLSRKADTATACFMLTNPNTLGIFESQILEISGLLHERGALLYYDGANMNALVGIARPGDMGFDVVHVNLHKTFAVPHGSGGPGSGPVGVKKILEPFLPSPRLKKDGEMWRWDDHRPQSIGKLRFFYGNVGAYLRSHCYLRLLGADGLRKVAEDAILNANYLKVKLAPILDMPHGGACMHEFVCSARNLKEYGVKGLDVAKRLLDYGFHAPTIYFPMIVEEALMIEPTETESRETLDQFIEALRAITREAAENPQLLKDAPHRTPIRRIDEVTAAREPNLRWRPAGEVLGTHPGHLGRSTAQTCCA